MKNQFLENRILFLDNPEGQKEAVVPNKENVGEELDAQKEALKQKLTEVKTLITEISATSPEFEKEIMEVSEYKNVLEINPDNYTGETLQQDIMMLGFLIAQCEEKLMPPTEAIQKFNDKIPEKLKSVISLSLNGDIAKFDISKADGSINHSVEFTNKLTIHKQPGTQTYEISDGVKSISIDFRPGSYVFSEETPEGNFMIQG